MIQLPGQSDDIEKTARRLMNTRAIFGIADRAASAINATAAGAFEALRYWLARTYAEGYEAGWRARASKKGEVMPPPEPHE